MDVVGSFWLGLVWFDLDGRGSTVFSENSGSTSLEPFKNASPFFDPQSFRAFITVYSRLLRMAKTDV